MSAGTYASRLREYPNKGVCGLPEVYETSRSLGRKIKQLATWMEESDNVVVLTGAGISTAAGIPDFRGPSGIWTLEQKKKKKQRKEEQKPVVNGKQLRKASSFGGSAVYDVVDNMTNRGRETSKKSNNKRSRSAEPETIQNECVVDFVTAKPTTTHRILHYLISTKNLVQFCVTQNVDGLHQRSGLSRKHLAVLHGCLFTERCEECGMEHFRDFEITTISFRPTGRRCDFCQGKLRDTLLDWEDPLPEKDYERSQMICQQADLILCLGTSLRIEPAGSLPTLGKRYVIVNLQETPKDSGAAMIIREKVDRVMVMLMEALDYAEWEHEPEPIIERHWKHEG